MKENLRTSNKVSCLIWFAGIKKGSACPWATLPTARGPDWITHLALASVQRSFLWFVMPRHALTGRSGVGTKSPLIQSSSQSAARFKPLMGKRKRGKNLAMCFLYSSPGAFFSESPAAQEGRHLWTTYIHIIFVLRSHQLAWFCDCNDGLTQRTCLAVDPHAYGKSNWHSGKRNLARQHSDGLVELWTCNPPFRPRERLAGVCLKMDGTIILGAPNNEFGGGQTWLWGPIIISHHQK